MAQHDYVIANGTGAAVRSDLNGSLAAIVSNNSGATEPATMYAYQWWADTTTGLLKLRNSANNAWISLRELDGTLTLEDGTAAAPGLAFTSDLNTGLFRVGADQVAITTGGTSRLAVSTTAVSSTLAVDVALGAVGTPALTFTGDLNTGIYSPGADQVAITTAGVQRVNFNAASEVVFNDGGADVDFRIEGDTNANLFKVDAGLDEVQVANLNGGPIAGTRNRIINGAVAVDQRNGGAAQTFTAAAALAYSVDRWYGYCTGANVTGQRVAGATAGQYRYQFTGAASVTAIGFGHRIEQLNSADLASTTATLGVDLANSLLTTVTWTAYYATTADTFGTLASPTRTQIATGTFTVTSTVTRYSTNISVPAAATTGIEIVFTVGAQTSGTWTIGNVQLEPGTVATPFERRSFGAELALCQRYYEKGYAQSVAPGTTFNYTGTPFASSNSGLSNYYAVILCFVSEKRATPTIVSYAADGSSGNVSGDAGGTLVTATADASRVNTRGLSIRQNGGTTYYGIQFQWTATAEL